MSGWSWLKLHIFPNPLKQATDSLSDPQPQYLLLSGTRPSTSSSQPRFKLCFTWESPSPAKVATISDCFIVQAEWPQTKIQVGADLGLYQLGNPRACAPSGKLQTMLEHHHPAPAQLILHRGQRLVVSGQNLSLIHI